MEFAGSIRGKRLHLADRPAFDAWVSAQPEGLAVRVEVKRRRRSKSANSYYWAVVVPMVAEHTGFTEEETHEALKALHLGREVKDLAGREIVCTKSSATLDSKEFAEYVDRCIAFAAAELGVAIPLPNQGDGGVNQPGL
ncbi:MAG: hypothetical protein ACOZHQ_09400 [Thermodesulfobacteriota bacterium]